MKKLFLLILFFHISPFSSHVFAQKQAWKWYFSYTAALDFSTGAPTLLTNSAMNQWEGSASIADQNGDLLFYTDGISVWNKNHLQMPNGFGLMGDYSSTQSAIIVPKPGDPNIYYIFTTMYSCYYSEVDLTLQGGLGDVTSTKNILLESNSAEKLAGVKHGNGIDFWVAMHHNSDSTFEAFLVTSAGVNTTSVISNVGNQLIGNIGQLQFSPDGSKAAMASYSSINMETIELFEFDNNTGIFFNQIGIPTTYFQTYGLEFSPNGKILYSGANSGIYEVHQWDLSSWNASDIKNSDIILGHTFQQSEPGSLQIAPDGKVYIAQQGTKWLAVIHEPDSLGAGCDYQKQGLNLNPDQVGLGLPNFLASYFLQIGKENFCLGDSTHFFASDTGGITSIDWDFGDPASGAANTASGIDVYHVYTDTGLFVVQIIKNLSSGGVDTSYTDVFINPVPIVFIGNDTTICIGDTIFLDAGNTGATFNWSTGETTQAVAIVADGLYYVDVSFGSCKAADTIDITVCPPIALSSSDTALCEKFCIDFFDLSTNNPVFWQWIFEGAAPAGSADQNPIDICYDDPGLFDVTLITTDSYGVVDTVVFTDYITVYTNPFAPSITQNGNVLTSSAADSYQWLLNGIIIPGATGQSYEITESGLYSVVIYDTNGCTSQSSVKASYVGIDDLNSSFIVSLLSNPATEAIVVMISGTNSGEIDISLVNTLGQELLHKKEPSHPLNLITLNVDFYPAAMYFLTITWGNSQRVLKVSKQ